VSRAPAKEALPTSSPTLFRWFSRYLRRYFRKNFTAVRLRASVDLAEERRPVVVYTNHPSWWDPIHFMLVHRHLMPNRRMYGPVEAKALEKYGILRRLGAFAVDLDSRRGAVDFLRTSRAVLAQPDGALWITAQGRFADVRERPLALQPGLAHLARTIPNLAIVPIAVEYPFWDERRPEALSLVGEPIYTAQEPSRSTESWRTTLERRLEETQGELAQLVQARDPSPFTVLVGGRTGVGGVYDVWRRLSAWVRGRRFDSAHGEAAP
jgi:1-acyl-sn-glycerol-3-phosphate acyltransferase